MIDVPPRLLDESGQIVLDHLVVADRLWPRFIGLMGCRSLKNGHGVYFPNCRSVHTLFMRFPIDLLFLDRDMRVVGLRRNLRPWSAAFAPKGTAGIVEAAQGGFCAEPAIGALVRVEQNAMRDN